MLQGVPAVPGVVGVTGPALILVALAFVGGGFPLRLCQLP